MANTYHQIYLQTVFAVKHRQALINKEWGKELYSTIGTLINDTTCKTIIVNGVEDHVHCLIGIKPSISISDLMKNIKAKSSKHINDHSLTKKRFEWQEGYGAFSYSPNHLAKVYDYIKNQEINHQKRTFMEEYIDLLKMYKINYKDEYLFHEPH